MGDPRKSRNKHKGPNHPWQRVRIEEERVIKREYGLKNKKEIWIANSELARVNIQAKRLIREKAKGNNQAVKEEQQLLERLLKLGIINEGTKLEEVLNLKTRDILNRRLQSIVFKRGLSLTPKQARQFVVHGNIFVDGKKINIPSYLVNREEEFKIIFDPKSSLASEDHPERVKKTQAREAVEKKRRAEEEAKAKESSVLDLTEEQLEKIEKEIVAVTVEE